MDTRTGAAERRSSGDGDDAGDDLPGGGRLPRSSGLAAVGFGTVEVREFEHAALLPPVEERGGRPLGLGMGVGVGVDSNGSNTALETPPPCRANGRTAATVAHGAVAAASTRSGAGPAPPLQFSVDRYEIAKQRRLRQRLQRGRTYKQEEEAEEEEEGQDEVDRAVPTMPQRRRLFGFEFDDDNEDDNKKNRSNRNDGDGDDDGSNAEYLETRPFDYREGKENPLFGRVPEDERRRRLLLLSQDSGENDNDEDKGTTDAAASAEVVALGASGGTATARITRTRRQQQQQQKPQQQPPSPQEEPALESRSPSGGLGCDCRRSKKMLVVHSKGKRRLAQEQLLRELGKRKIDIDIDEDVRCLLLSPPSQESQQQKPLPPLPQLRPALRLQLEQKLRDAMANEPCCADPSSCPCAKNGIGCQDETCTCCTLPKTRARAAKTAASAETSATEDGGGNDNDIVDAMRNRCGNPYGMYVYDKPRIDSYRAERLKEQQQQLLRRQVQVQENQDGNLYCREI